MKLSMKEEFLETSFCVHFVNYLNNIYSSSAIKTIFIGWQNLAHVIAVWAQDSSLWKACLLIKVAVVRFLKIFFDRIDGVHLPPDTLCYSKVVQFFIASYHNFTEKLQHYLKTSTAGAGIEGFKREFSSSPLTTIGTILTSAVTVNIVLSILLQRPVSLWGWFMRILFLVLGAGAVFCREDLMALKKNSFFLRKLRKWK